MGEGGKHAGQSSRAHVLLLKGRVAEASRVRA